MLVTLFRIVMLVKEEHLAKAPQPIFVTGFPPSSDGMVRGPDGLGKTFSIVVSSL